MTQKIARRRNARLAQLESAASKFAQGQSYSEPEVNELLKQLFDDHVFARRLLIEWGYLDRQTDGSAYWRKQPSN